MTWRNYAATKYVVAGFAPPPPASKVDAEIQRGGVIDLVTGIRDT